MISLFVATGALAEEPEPEEDEADEEVVVTGTRSPRRLGDAPVAVEVIDRDTIERSGAQDVAEVLEQQRGVDVQRSVLGAGIRLRGLDADHTLILVDGQRIVGAKDGTVDLSRFPIDSIERIEIVKGASSALYGSDALGGVVNLITRRSKANTEANAMARGGAPRSVDASAGVGARSERAGLRADVGWHGSPAFDRDPNDFTTDVNALRQLQLSGQGDWTPDPNLTLSLRGSWAGQDAQGVDNGLGGAVLDRRNLTEDAVGNFTATWLPDEQSRLATTVGLSVFRDQYAADQRRAADLDLYEETFETLAQLTTQYDRVWGRQVFSVGLEGFTSEIRSPRLDDGRGTRLRGAVYAQDEITVVTDPRWVVVPGVRGDVDSWFGGAMAPSLGTRLDPLEGLTLRGSVGVGWRAPSFRELLLRFDNAGVGYQVTGNPDLRPERSLSTSVGMEIAPTDAVSISVEAHHDQLQNLIQLTTLDDDPGDTVFGYDNIARARTQGIEAGLGWDPSLVFGVDLSGTLLDAIDLETGDTLEGRANLRGTVAVRLKPLRGGPGLTTRAMIVGPRPFYVDEAFGLGGPAGGGGDRVDAPAYALMDARLEQRLVDDLRLFAGVENLLDAGDPRYLPTPPRLIYAGIDARVASKGSRP